MRAKARGVKLGREAKLTEHQQREMIRRRDQLIPSPRLRGEGRGEGQVSEPEG